MISFYRSFLLVFLSCCCVACGTKNIVPVLTHDDGAPLSLSQQEEVFERFNADTIPEEMKRLATARFSRDGNPEPRVRLALRGNRNGRFQIQVLPVTSLMVMQRIEISPNREILISDASSASEEAVTLSANSLRAIVGEIIEPWELYVLLHGKIPQSVRFREFHNQQGRFYQAEQGRQFFLSERLQIRFYDHHIEHVVLREPFQDRIVLVMQFENYQVLEESSFPLHTTMHFPKRALALDLYYR